jgi:Uma2 family endonuclease
MLCPLYPAEESAIFINDVLTVFARDIYRCTIHNCPYIRTTLAIYSGSIHQMIAAGILTSNDPVELLAGWLVQKRTKNPPHRMSTRLILEALESIVPNGWYIETQEPITLKDSEPEPDVAMIKGNTRNYLDRHPGAVEVALVVEVADSTLERDRSLKQQIYARAGIPTYWIANLVNGQLEIYTQPTLDGYQSQIMLSQGSAEVVLGNQRIGLIAIDMLFPSQKF